MKTQNAITALIRAAERLEAEKTIKIHEVWKLETKIGEIKERLKQAGFPLIKEEEPEFL